MDTREMRDRIKQKAPESVAIKRTPDHSFSKRRVRSYKSLIINLVALIGLFALVFALQQVGTRHTEKPAPAESASQVTQVTAAEVTVEELAPAAAPSKPAEEKIQNQEVAMVEFETTKEGAAQPKAQAKIILKTKKAKTATTPRKTVQRGANYGQSWREDRLHSASLVEMLDGPATEHNKHQTYSAQQTYATAAPQQQPTCASPSSSYSGRTDRTSSAQLVEMLDGRGSQPSTQRTNKFNWADEVPMASTQTSGGIEETTLVSQTGTRTYATAEPQQKPTYVAPSRRPAWDVNAGEYAK